MPTTSTAVTDEQITARYACNCYLLPGVHPAGQCACLLAGRGQQPPTSEGHQR